MFKVLFHTKMLKKVIMKAIGHVDRDEEFESSLSEEFGRIIIFYIDNHW